MGKRGREGEGQRERETDRYKDRKRKEEKGKGGRKWGKREKCVGERTMGRANRNIVKIEKVKG